MIIYTILEKSSRSIAKILLADKLFSRVFNAELFFFQMKYAINSARLSCGKKLSAQAS